MQRLVRSAVSFSAQKSGHEARAPANGFEESRRRGSHAGKSQQDNVKMADADWPGGANEAGRKKMLFNEGRERETGAKIQREGGPR